MGVDVWEGGREGGREERLCHWGEQEPLTSHRDWSLKETNQTQALYLPSCVQDVQDPSMTINHCLLLVCILCREREKELPWQQSQGQQLHCPTMWSETSNNSWNLWLLYACSPHTTKPVCLINHFLPHTEKGICPTTYKQDTKKSCVREAVVCAQLAG